MQRYAREHGIGFVVRSAALDFQRPARFNDALVATATVVRLGRASGAAMRAATCSGERPRRRAQMRGGPMVEAGLIVPVIKGADGMNCVGLARSIADLAARARSRQLQPDEVQGSTFTITNPGPYGSIASVPIINTPNTAILSLDAITKRAVVVDDAIAIRSIVNISMSWDHRVIDGELATKFLGRVKSNLEGWDYAEDLGL